jgi:hypothetical protein
MEAVIAHTAMGRAHRSAVRGVSPARPGRTDDDDNPFEFALARETKEFDAVFRLVHDQYVARGYMDPQPSGRRLSLHNAVPSTKVFIASCASRVVGTITLIEDSRIGLPMDDIYREELAGFRGRGRRIAEVSALAIDDEYRASGTSILIRLVRLAVLYATEIGQLDDLCFAVNPRHVDFYCKLIPSVRQLGALKEYQRVNGAPAVALHSDLDLVRAFARAVRSGCQGLGQVPEFFFGGSEFLRIVARLQRECSRSTLTLKQFRRLFGGHEVLMKATSEHRGFVQSIYPGVDLEALIAESLFGRKAPLFAMAPA